MLNITKREAITVLAIMLGAYALYLLVTIAALHVMGAV